MKEIKDLDELKKIELDIMKDIHDFCEINDIKYYLAYGTLIGAMRHKGFIPWDDDIDVWMFRDDYIRFEGSFSKYASEHGLYIATYNTKPLYPRNMMKVCSDKTLLIEKEFAYQDPIGVFVDIWPIDGVPIDIFARKKHYFLNAVLRHLFEVGVRTKQVSTSRSKLILKNIAAPISRAIGINRILWLQIKLSKKYTPAKSSILECYSAPYALNHFFASDFDHRELVPFENLMLYIPKGYDRVLTMIYGDWERLPQKEKQVPHHISDIWWK